MEQNPKEKILAELRKGRKTWTQLTQSLKMSSRTISKYLTKLMNDGIVGRYGVVESGRKENYYDLVKRKNLPIVVKIPRMFEKSNSFFPIKIKKDLDIEQDLVRGFYSYFAQLMHMTRKTLDAYYAKELTPNQRIKYVNNWKKGMIDYTSEWMDGFIEGTIQYGQESWRDIFGRFEDNPTPFFKAVVKFGEILDEAEKKSDEEFRRKLKEGKIESINLSRKIRVRK